MAYTGRRDRREHPSNRLYNGEAETFEQAVDLAVGACDYELHAATGGDPEADRQVKSSVGGYKKALGEALRVYQERVGGASRDAERTLIEEWKASGDDYLKMFAECVEAGDYSPLAI